MRPNRELNELKVNFVCPKLSAIEKKKKQKVFFQCWKYKERNCELSSSSEQQRINVDINKISISLDYPPSNLQSSREQKKKKKHKVRSNSRGGLLTEREEERSSQYIMCVTKKVLIRDSVFVIGSRGYFEYCRLCHRGRPPPPLNRYYYFSCGSPYSQYIRQST